MTKGPKRCYPMTDPAFNAIVSEETQNRLARAEFEMKIAQREWLAAWETYNRELYARCEMATAKAEEHEHD